MKLFFFIFLSLVLFSCHSGIDPLFEEEEIISTEKQSLEQKITRKIESFLGVSATENYSIQFEYGFINQDTIQDIIALVNRKEYAIQHYKQNNSANFLEKVGNTAPYNYVFLLLGNSDQLISTTPIGSNINYLPSINFLELTSPAKDDFYIEYRIRNSLYRNYYTYAKGNLNLIFSCPVYDKVGERNIEVYKIVHQNSPLRIAKDIAMYYGEVPDYNPSNIEDVDNYTPKEILQTSELFAYFIYNEKTLKYVTPMHSEAKE